MAMAAKHLEARFDRDKSGLFDHRIFGICSDGDLMEGVASEAASIAGHLGLGNIVFLYDDNHVTIDGHTELSFDEDVVKRFDAYEWHTQDVADANDLDGAVEGDRKWNRRDQPPVADSRALDHRLRQPAQAGHVGRAQQSARRRRGEADQGILQVSDRTAVFRSRRCTRAFPPVRRARRGAGVGIGARSSRPTRKKIPAEAGEFQAALAKDLPAGWDAELPVFTPKDSLATRVSASQAEAAIAKKVWWLFGGSADLNESTFTDVKDGGDFERGHYDGRNPHFGIREHGMCSILNGIALHGGFIPYGSSFLCFTDYARPSIRLAALMEHAGGVRLHP